MRPQKRNENQGPSKDINEYNFVWNEVDWFSISSVLLNAQGMSDYVTEVDDEDDEDEKDAVHIVKIVDDWVP